MYLIATRENKYTLVFQKDLFLRILNIKPNDLVEFTCRTMGKDGVNELVIKFSNEVWEKIEDKLSSFVDGELVTDFIINHTAKKLRLLFNENGDLTIK